MVPSSLGALHAKRKAAMAIAQSRSPFMLLFSGNALAEFDVT